MYYKTKVSANKLEKQMLNRNFKLYEKNVLGLEAYVVGDELIHISSAGFLTREDHFIFFANLIEYAAMRENLPAEKFLSEVQEIIEHRIRETAAKRKIPLHRYIRRGKTVTLEFDCNGKVDSYTFEIKNSTVEECDAKAEALGAEVIDIG